MLKTERRQERGRKTIIVVMKGLGLRLRVKVSIAPGHLDVPGGEMSPGCPANIVKFVVTMPAMSALHGWMPCRSALHGWMQAHLHRRLPISL